TLSAINVEAIVKKHLKISGNTLYTGDVHNDLARFPHIIVMAIGKASLPMARAAESILGSRITNGLVVTNELSDNLPERLRVIVGGHPLPNAGSVKAAEMALEMLRSNDSSETLVLFLISGGGSALFEKPIDSQITLDDLRKINRVLVGCGAVIGEMNVVRRFLSSVKGGRLAEAAPHSRQISLYISDVNSDDLTTVSSGPTLPTSSTRDDFNRIVERYDLLNKFSSHVAEIIASDTLPDMPQFNSELTNQHTHQLLLDNRQALNEAKRIAERLNCVVEIAYELVEGDVDEMAAVHLDRVRRLSEEHPGRVVCLLSGGEVICPVRGNGAGGRNQEFVLRAAIKLDQELQKKIVVLSAGTDGIDGHSPAAGAMADNKTIHRANENGLSAEDFLVRSDSFNFFRALNDTLMTGPTGNNVRDLRILLAN
ncbi:MAG TPA: DUF4147 domain-containing protein, partial [Blastocatellia bacterium]|nr:DUF4147 domain-containing protein [Blastocatellia bacterium]